MSADVHDLSDRLQRLGRSGFDRGGGGGDNDDMDIAARVGHLETDMKDVRDRLARMETKMEGFATKGDLADTKAEIIKWVVGTAVGLGVAAITVMTFVLNNAVPKAPAAAQQPPIIINVPGAAPAQPTPK